MQTTIIRRAEPADALALAQIGRITFSETFGHLYPPKDLQAFLAQAHDVGTVAGLLSDPAFAAWIVERDGEAIGHGLAGPNHLPHPQVTTTCGEIKRLYLTRRSQGLGLGEQLLGLMLGWLERDGPRDVWLGVWSENHGAQRFYRRFGFEKVGSYEFPVGETRDQEFILRRPARFSS